MKKIQDLQFSKQRGSFNADSSRRKRCEYGQDTPENQNQSYSATFPDNSFVNMKSTENRENKMFKCELPLPIANTQKIQFV